jgi:uncharacterized Ntn-hydrolase superfamily protein
MTFSLVARCSDTGMFGVAISSSSPAVAARCPYARAGVGAVSSQNITDPRLGPAVLDALETYGHANEALAAVMDPHEFKSYRQVLLVDHKGIAAVHSGEHALGNWSSATGLNVASGGNLLDNIDVPQAIVDAFVASDGHLGDRLIHAMQTGLSAGGEAGPIHSAGMLLVDKVSWPVADLRCDWSDECPIENIASLWGIYKPQLNDYVKRALNPGDAPSYGVPGDD